MWNLRVTFVNFAYRGRKRKFLSLFANNGNTLLSYSVPSIDVNKEIVLNDLRADETVDEELEQKRNKSRLPEEVISKYIKREVPPLVAITQYANLNIRYGRYGKRCGLNPGIAWPTKQELLECIEDSKLLDPPLQETLQKCRAEKEEKMRERLEYEAEVDRNMEKADSYMQEYLKKIEEKKAVAKALQAKKILLIEEISEFLGYDVDPKDPKFQEAVEMKEKEKKKAKKAMKQQESYEKMLAQLAKIAANSKADSTSIDSEADSTSVNSKADATSSDTKANPNITEDESDPNITEDESDPNITEDKSNPTTAKSKADPTANVSFKKDKDTGS